MGLQKGQVTMRRYRVLGQLPKDFRTSFPKALGEKAFQEPATAIWTGPVVGWCRTDNMIETDFSDINKWLLGQYAMFSLRKSEKKVNSKRLAAYLRQRCAAWMSNNNRQRCPSRVKSEIKEQLTQEMMLQTMPSDQITEIVWDIVEGRLYVSSLADAANDQVRTLFRNTFGMVLVPNSPLDWLGGDEALIAHLECTGLSDYRPESM